MSKPIVCSFFTNDEYYRNHAIELRKNLDDLGIDHCIEEVQSSSDEDWVDICRKKVSFLTKVCEKNPEKKVIWIDVDCRILELPDFILNSSADIIGFQRGFSPPIAIGYRNHARFWEPCFWGIGTSSAARKMIKDAAVNEAQSKLKATDDYFFEEAWRANADSLTFQLIPSACVVGRQPSTTIHPAFFVFGSSGKVPEFKDKVSQHVSEQRPKWVRKQIVKKSKLLLKFLPQRISRYLISKSDQLGLTHFLLGYGYSGLKDGRSQQQRRAITDRILRAGINGEAQLLQHLIDDLKSSCLTNPNEEATIEIANSFNHYASQSSKKTIHLSWWVRPFPGNFGDWLSPLIYSHYSNSKIKFQTPTAPSKVSQKHIVSVGSIARFIKKSSVVVGTGIASTEYQIEANAHYFSVRGPITAKFLASCGGPDITSFGDPAAVISRIFPFERGATNGRVALVRHASHNRVPLTLPENFDELDILISNPKKIQMFLYDLHKYDEVVTSALHVFIVCQSYGIPCSLITFEGVENSISGTGLKYADYSLGVGLKELIPLVVARDLRKADLEETRHLEVIPESKKDEIEEKIIESIAFFNNERAK